MQNELGLVRMIACDPQRWSARLAMVQQFDVRNLTVQPMLTPGQEAVHELNARLLAATPPILRRLDDEDDNEETDVWGDPLPRMEMDEDVAIVPVQGVIYTGLPSLFKRYGYVDLDDIAEDIEEAMGNENCRAIVLDVDSPGGTLRSLPEFGSMIASYAASGKKPIAARVEGLGCSAAYWSIAGCNVISAAPSAELVNIGVYQVNYNLVKYFEMFGVRVEVYKSGKYKAAGYPGTELSEDQKTDLQAGIDDLGEQFRSHVAACRPSADVANMQGQCFFGTKAMQLGFADDDAPTFAAFMARFRALLNAR